MRVGSYSALLLALPSVLAAQNAAGVVVGRVVTAGDSGAPSPAVGATVGVVGASIAATTRSDGRFLLARVPSGEQTLRVRLIGHRSLTQRIIVTGDTARIELLMHPEARLLDPLRTSARASEAERFETRPSIGTVALDASAIDGIPSVGEPDVVRVAQLLPGVVARNDFNTGLTVRGGEADQNLILLDGHPIHNPFHLGGLFSTFMDATVGGIELVTSAFPARYGGRLSSVLDVRSADEVREGTHGSVDLSALATTGRLTGTIENGRGSWSVAARRTYADAVTRLFTSNIFPYHFRDAQARGTYLLPGDVRLGITAYLGKDILDANLAEFASGETPSRAGEGSWAFDWGNRLLGISVAKDFGRSWLGDAVTLEQRVSTSGFATRLDLGDGAATQRSEIRDLRATGTLNVRRSAHDVTVGYEVASHRLRYVIGSTETGTTEIDLVQTPVTAAAWVEELWRLSPRLVVQGGLRAETISTRSWGALSPRASIKFFATPDLALTAGAGRVTQWLQSLAGDGALRYFDIWLASDDFIPVASAWHYVAGAERRLRTGSVRVEGFVKRYDRLMEANWSDDPGRRGDEFFEARGLSYGADLLARWQPTERLSGWVSYTYGLSTRERDGARWAPGHDRRHDLDVVATWRAGRYRIGSRFGYASGTPYTPIVGELARRVYDPSRDLWGTGDPTIFVDPLGGPRNSARFPAEHRLDLDVSREFLVRGATLSPYLSVANAYNARNVFVYLYEYSTDRPYRRAISQFPVLPSLGVRVAF